MGDPAGYHWTIEGRDADWTWTVRKGEGDVIVTGAAQTRAHAAACVVRALVRGMTVVPTYAMAAQA